MTSNDTPLGQHVDKKRCGSVLVNAYLNILCRLGMGLSGLLVLQCSCAANAKLTHLDSQGSPSMSQPLSPCTLALTSHRNQQNHLNIDHSAVWWSFFHTTFTECTSAALFITTTRSCAIESCRSAICSWSLLTYMVLLSLVQTAQKCLLKDVKHLNQRCFHGMSQQALVAKEQA